MENDIHVIAKDLISRYEALQRENQALKAELAELKRKVKKDEKANFKISQSLNLLPLSLSHQSPIKKSNPFFQLKQIKTTMNSFWLPIAYDFTDAVLSVHLNRSNQVCCFGTADSSIEIFQLDFSNVSQPTRKSLSEINATHIAEYKGHHGAINCITKDPITGMYASTSGDGTTHIWSLPDPSSFTQSIFLDSKFFTTISKNTSFSDHTGPVLGAAWADSSLYTISGTGMSIWDVLTSDRVSTTDFGSNALCIDSSPETCAVVGLQNGDLRLFDYKSPTSTVIHGKGNASVLSLKLYDSTIITAHLDKTIRRYDIRNGAEISSFEIDHVPTKIDINDDIVVVPIEDGRVRLLSLRTGAISVFDTIPFSYTTSCAVWIDNNSILCTSWDGSASVGRFSF